MRRVERGSERPRRVMEARSSRPVRDPERLGDLDERESDVVVEHEDCPLIERQLPERTIELVPIADRADLVGVARAIGRQEADGRGPLASPRRLRVALVDEDPEGSRLEPLRLA